MAPNFWLGNETVILGSVTETGKAGKETDSGGKKMLSFILGHVQFKGLTEHQRRNV